MKKILLTLCLIAGVAFSASAQKSRQDNTVGRKSGQYVLPVAGDFAIGIDANPFLNYMGSFFGKNNAASAPTFNGFKGNIYGKYFLEDNRAIRARLALDLGSTKYRYTIADDEEIFNNPLNLDATTNDIVIDNSTMADLFVGYEFRRGYGRLQAFYGGEIGFGFATGKTTYEYGNPMTSYNNTPTTADFGGGTHPAVRTLNIKNGAAFRVGLNAFVGAEYFIGPKISIGGELALGVRYASQGQSTRETEQWDSVKDEIQYRSKRTSGGVRDFGLKTPINGNLFLMIYF